MFTTTPRTLGFPCEDNIYYDKKEIKIVKTKIYSVKSFYIFGETTPPQLFAAKPNKSISGLLGRATKFYALVLVTNPNKDNLYKHVKTFTLFHIVRIHAYTCLLYLLA